MRTFPKQVEATNGADWEWHIVGLRRTLRMRVRCTMIRGVGEATQPWLAARFCARAQESRRPTVRLKTGAPGVETGSGQK